MLYSGQSSSFALVHDLFIDSGEELGGWYPKGSRDPCDIFQRGISLSTLNSTYVIWIELAGCRQSDLSEPPGLPKLTDPSPEGSSHGRAALCIA